MHRSITSPRLHNLSSSISVLESPQRHQHRTQPNLWLIHHWRGFLRHLLTCMEISFHVGCARSTKALLCLLCAGQNSSYVFAFAESRQRPLPSPLPFFCVWGLWSKHTDWLKPLIQPAEQSLSHMRWYGADVAPDLHYSPYAKPKKWHTKQEFQTDVQETSAVELAQIHIQGKLQGQNGLLGLWVGGRVDGRHCCTVLYFFPPILSLLQSL